MGDNLCGVTGGVHGGVESGERGGRCGGVCEVCWEFDVRRGVFLLQDLMNVKRFVFLRIKKNMMLKNRESHYYQDRP